MNYLNLGCGLRFHSEWVNVDFASSHPSVSECDLRKGIPYPDNRFEVAYHSHVLEHFTKHDALCFLKECHRVVEPNGTIRVAVPDLEGIVNAYLQALDMALQGDEQGIQNYEWMMLEMYDQVVRQRSGGSMFEYLKRSPLPNESFIRQRMGGEAARILEGIRRIDPQPFVSYSHFQRLRSRLLGLPRKLRSAVLKALLGRDAHDMLSVARFRSSGEIHQWMYDRYSLKGLLESAGFTDAKRVGPTESRIPDWTSYNLDTDPDGTVYKPDSLYMEATKR